MLTGVRGVGKPVTLHALAAEAQAGRFVVVTTLIDRTGSLTTRVAASIAGAMVSLGPLTGSRWTRWKARMNRLSVEVSVAGIVKVIRPATDPAELPQDERDVLIALIGESASLVIRRCSSGDTCSPPRQTCGDARRDRSQLDGFAEADGSIDN